MRKFSILSIAMLLFLICMPVMAQVTVGTWGRGFFVPLMGADGEVTSGTLVSWGAPVRTGLSFTGTSDNVGFQIDFNVDGGGFVADDKQFIWVKPIDMLTISLGYLKDDTLRGSGSFGSYHWLRTTTMVGDGLIFGRVGEFGSVNVEISLAPVEGLYAFVAFGGNGGVDLMVPPPAFNLAEDMLKLGQYGAGYTIANIGTIRAQLFGRPTIIDEAWFLVQAAFKLTAVPNLCVDVGGTFPTDNAQAGYDVIAALYASYAMEMGLTVHLLGHMKMVAEDLGFGAGLGVDYDIGGGLGVYADFRYQNDIFSGLTDGLISFGLGVNMGFSNGLIGVGFEGTTGYLVGGAIDKTDPSALSWALPIKLEYWF